MCKNKIKFDGQCTKSPEPVDPSNHQCSNIAFLQTGSCPVSLDNTSVDTFTLKAFSAMKTITGMQNQAMNSVASKSFNDQCLEISFVTQLIACSANRRDMILCLGSNKIFNQRVVRFYFKISGLTASALHQVLVNVIGKRRENERKGVFDDICRSLGYGPL
ncbi:hypothetical protein ACOME3_000585 [Neoechinorhynchus agilis]